MNLGIYHNKTFINLFFKIRLIVILLTSGQGRERNTDAQKTQIIESDFVNCQMEVIPSTPLVMQINSRRNSGLDNEGAELDEMEAPNTQSSTLTVFIK